MIRGTIGVYIYTAGGEPLHTTDLPAVPSDGDHLMVHGDRYRVVSVEWHFDASEPSVKLLCEEIDHGGGA